MARTVTTTDWAALIEQLIGRGLGINAIGDAMQLQLNGRMLRHYGRGAQPAHFRGEALIALWCQHTGQSRDDAPQCALVRGHRVAHNREMNSTPRAQALPQWPPIEPAKRKRGRPRKEAK